MSGDQKPYAHSANKHGQWHGLRDRLFPAVQPTSQLAATLAAFDLAHGTRNRHHHPNARPLARASAAK